MAKMKASRRERFFSTLILLLVICLIILVLAIVADSKLSRPSDRPTQSVGYETTSTPEPLTLSLLHSPTPPAEPTPTPSPTPSPTPTPIPEVVYDFLPVYTGAETEERIVAIVIEECENLDNLRMAIAGVHEIDPTAKLTLFPLGQSVMKDGMKDILNLCVRQLGWQVENRTWSNALLHRLGNDQMSNEIWAPGIAVNYMLDADYKMHLFHMHGGSGTRDVRTHEYLKQLGYDGIVNWSRSAAKTDIDDLRRALKPGSIIAFTTSDSDLEKLSVFMNHAKEWDYRFVTVNELLGFEENTVGPAIEGLLAQTLPTLENYEPLYLEHRLNDRSYQIFLIQRRLGQLGYLPLDGADGVFGEATSAALSEFQAAAGLLGSGVATTETQIRLFAEDAPAKQMAELFN